MTDKEDQKSWDDPELDWAQADSDAVFAEMDGLKALVETGDMTIEQAQARFIELLERHRVIGERLLAITRAWALRRGTPERLPDDGGAPVDASMTLILEVS